MEVEQFVQVTETGIPSTIALQDLEEYVGIFVGYEQDSLGYTIHFDSCQIAFFKDELENSESLEERLNDIPTGRRVGVLVTRQGSRKRVRIRFVGQS